MDQEGNPTGAKLVVGRYVTLGELGRGGMGIVWRAEDRVIGRQVALKELPIPPAVNDERDVYLERVLREARTAGRLNDPAVVTVYDVVSEHGSIYIVMELVEGPTLAEVMTAEGPLPSDRVSAIGLQVLGALETAHAAGIVHRDVKPSNIMVLPGDRAKLADFGIAQAMDDPSLTATGGIMGSPGYLAPELFAGSSPAPQSDLWALGATLFYAVEGRPPFQRDTTAATMHAIMYDDPRLERCQGPLATAIMGLVARPVESRLDGPRVRALLTSATQAVNRPDQSDQTTQAMVSGEATTGFVDTRTAAVGSQPRSTRPRERWQDPYDADAGATEQGISAPTPVTWDSDWTPERGPSRRKLALLSGAAALAAVMVVGAVFLLSPGAQSQRALAKGADITSSPGAGSASGAPTATGHGSGSPTATASGSAKPSGSVSAAATSRTTATGTQSTSTGAKVTTTQAQGQPPTRAPGDPGTSSTPPPPSRVPVALTRYNHPTGWHYSGTADFPAPQGFTAEFLFGSLVAKPEPGVQKLYACKETATEDRFTSIDQSGSCENQTKIGFLGYIFAQKPTDVPTAPIYRCNAGASHFDSLYSGCEGNGTNELTLGYVVIS